MIQKASGKPELTKIDETDPEQLGRLLELELAAKRTEWKRASTRNQTLRMMSFLFLFVVIVGAMLAFFLVFSRVGEERGNQPLRHSAETSKR
jgi:hypothetical protein